MIIEILDDALRVVASEPGILVADWLPFVVEHVVAQDAHERGVEVVFADNELVPVGVLDLDTELVRLADQAIAREAVAS